MSVNSVFSTGVSPVFSTGVSNLFLVMQISLVKCDMTLNIKKKKKKKCPVAATNATIVLGSGFGGGRLLGLAMKLRKNTAFFYKAVLELQVSPAFAITYFCNHCHIRFDPIPILKMMCKSTQGSLCPSPMKIHY